MTSPQHLTHAELSTPSQMHRDCEQVGEMLNARMVRAAASVSAVAPSIHFDEFPREVSKKDIKVSEAAQRLANALHLHLD